MLITSDKVAVPAYKTTLFGCQPTPDTPPGTYVASFLDNTPGLANQPGVSIANCIVDVKLGQSPSLMVVNETGYNHTIPKGTAVAVLSEQDTKTLCEINNPEDNCENKKNSPSRLRPSAG